MPPPSPPIWCCYPRCQMSETMQEDEATPAEVHEASQGSIASCAEVKQLGFFPPSHYRSLSSDFIEAIAFGRATLPTSHQSLRFSQVPESVVPSLCIWKKLECALKVDIQMINRRFRRSCSPLRSSRRSRGRLTSFCAAPAAVTKGSMTKGAFESDRSDHQFGYCSGALRTQTQVFL